MKNIDCRRIVRSIIIMTTIILVINVSIQRGFTLTVVLSSGIGGVVGGIVGAMLLGVFKKKPGQEQ